MLRDRIDSLVKQHGSIRAAARVLGVDHAYLWRLQTGTKNNPSDSLLRKLKLRRVVSISYMPSGANHPPEGG